MMIRAANLLQEARRADRVTGRVDVMPDWAPVAARIRQETTGDWNDSYAVARFEAKGGRFVLGRGMFTGPRTIAVDSVHDTGTRAVVVATGPRPRVPPIPALSDVP